MLCTKASNGLTTCNFIQLLKQRRAPLWGALFLSPLLLRRGGISEGRGNDGEVIFYLPIKRANNVFPCIATLQSFPQSPRKVRENVDNKPSFTAKKGHAEKSFPQVGANIVRPFITPRKKGGKLPPFLIFTHSPPMHLTDPYKLRFAARRPFPWPLSVPKLPSTVCQRD